MRLRNNSKANSILESSNLIIDKFPIKLNSKTIIEIGMGKGEMLTQLALNNPNLIYLGIEKYPTVAAMAAKRAKALNLNNFFIICQDVSQLENAFEGKVDEIWLTFSDPWPKKRHFKRRLTYKAFLDFYKKILSKKGVLKIKTDNDQFFDWSIDSINEYGANIIYKTNDLHNSSIKDKNIKTGYEEKWTQKGKNINYMEVVF